MTGTPEPRRREATRGHGIESGTVKTEAAQISYSTAKKEGRRLLLQFIGEPACLDRIEFTFKSGKKPTFLERGNDQHPLDWPEVESAFSLCLLGYVEWVMSKKPGRFRFGVTSGESKLAKKISRAIYQSKHEIHNLFFGDNPRSKGSEPCVTHLVFPKAPGSNKGGRNKNKPILIVVDEKFLPIDCIEILWDSKSSGDFKRLASFDEIRTLKRLVRDASGLPVTESEASELASSICEFGVNQGNSNQNDPQPIFPTLQFVGIHQLPPIPANFTGRDEDLAELVRNLDPSLNNKASQFINYAVLEGAPGVGKTALATVLAHRLSSFYRDAQIVLNLRGAGADQAGMYQNVCGMPLTPLEAMRTVLRALNPQAALPNTLDETVPIYRSVLAGKKEVDGKLSERRILLLFDNAANTEQIRPLLPPENCLALVTSRAQIILPGVINRKVDCLQAQEATILLLMLAERIQGHEEEAAALCGNLPLALEAFAGAIRHRTLTSVSELVERLRLQLQKLDIVDAAFDVSYGLLSRDERRDFRFLGLFPSSFDLEAASALWGEATRTPDSLEQDGGIIMDPKERMQVLVNAGLVEWNPSNDRFTLHDCGKRFCQRRLTIEDRSLGTRRYCTHYQSVSMAIDLANVELPEQARCLRAFDLDQPNFQAAIENLLLKQDDESAFVAISLISSLRDLLFVRLPADVLLKYFEGELAAAQKLRKCEAEARALSSLARINGMLGNGELQVELYEQALVALRKYGTPEELVACLTSIGNMYMKSGNFARALKCSQEQFEIGARIGNGSIQAVATINACPALLRIGNPQMAMEGLTLVIRLAREGNLHRLEWQAQMQLGGILNDCGQFRAALDALNKALEIHRKFDIPGTEGGILIFSAQAHYQLGEIDRAITHGEAALRALVPAQKTEIAEMQTLLELCRAQQKSKPN